MEAQPIHTPGSIDFGSKPLSITDSLFEDDNADYKHYLNRCNIAFSSLPPYLLVGDIPMSTGWLIHISVVKQQMPELIKILLNFLALSRLTFAIPSDSDRHAEILDGRSGPANTGKVVTVFLPPGHLGIDVACEMIRLTEGFKGPAIPTAVKISGCLYVQYGTFFEQAEFFRNKHYSPVYGFNAENALVEHLHFHNTTWPFHRIKRLSKNRVKRFLHGRYLPVQVLKNDAKGDVLKCIQLRKLYNMRYCVVKQGRRFQCFDNAGRDTKDRLLWQYQVHKLLEAELILPVALDLFESGDAHYLVLEYIDGAPLNEKLAGLHKGTIWKFLETGNKREILNYLNQILNILNSFHKNGLVHRDVTPGNFLITDDGKAVAIDIELSYSCARQEPSPAFALGTAGYMSPQQINGEVPSFEEDIYGFGSLMIKGLTGLSPGKVEHEDLSILYEDLYFHLGYEPVVEVICQCLHKEPRRRPSLSDIRHVLDIYDVFLLTAPFDHAAKNAPAFTCRAMKNVIQMCLNGLAVNDTRTGLQWLAKGHIAENVISNENLNYCWYPGFYSGAAGILFTLNKAHDCGFRLENLTQSINYNCTLLQRAMEYPEKLDPSISEGTYGIAMVMTSLDRSVFFKDVDLKISRMSDWLNTPAVHLGIATGLSGQGIALLSCGDFSRSNLAERQLSAIVSCITDKQNDDGSWLIRRGESQARGIKLNGFAYGISGIIYFLSTYRSHFNDSKVDNCITKGLGYLISQRKPVEGNYLWWLNDKNSVIDPWMEYGFSGIALTFIKAFEIYQDPVYKEVAVSALLCNPKYISSNYFTIGNGLAGLGEIYIEAYRIFKDKEWKERSEHIACYLTHCCRRDGSRIYWLEGSASRAAQDLMAGNSGIIHFLMRAVYPDRLNFPFALH